MPADTIAWVVRQAEEGRVDGLNADDLRRVVEMGKARGGLAQIALQDGAVELAGRYSLGEPVDGLAPVVQSIAQEWAWLFDFLGERLHEPHWRKSVGVFDESNLGLFATFVDVLAFAAVFGDQASARTLLASPPARESFDPVLAVLAQLVGVEVPKRSYDILDPKLFETWMSVARAEPSDREEALFQYVGAWHQTRSNAGNLLDPGHASYAGHWCVDAAPLAIYLDIDDTRCRQFAWYPADLVDHGRSLRSNTGAVRLTLDAPNAFEVGESEQSAARTSADSSPLVIEGLDSATQRLAGACLNAQGRERVAALLPLVTGGRWAEAQAAPELAEWDWFAHGAAAGAQGAPTPVDVVMAVGRAFGSVGWSDWKGEDFSSQVETMVTRSYQLRGMTAPSWDGLDALTDPNAEDSVVNVFRVVDARLQSVGARLIFVDLGDDAFHFFPVPEHVATDLDGLGNEEFQARLSVS